MDDKEFKDNLQKHLMNMADLLMKKYNPCKFDGASCAGGNPNPCCFNTRFGAGLCPFMINGMCHNPNFECKSWFCETAIKNMSPECYQAFLSLENLGKAFNLIGKPFLGEPYVGADKA